jgi:hypothetical protein
MLKMRILAGIAIFVAFCPALKAQNQKARASDLPDRFEIGRRTYFDFGPPFDYYEIFVVRSAADGTSTVARVLLTPQGMSCMAPAKTEFAKARLDASVADLLKPVNPCDIPEKELNREEKRCRHCLNFSGADVSMQVPCGGSARIIHAKILEKDWFDQVPETPGNTRRSLGLMAVLDKAIGPGVMEKPAFQFATGAASGEIPDTEISNDLTMGKYDSLFAGARDKPSDLYAAALKGPPSPTARVVRVEPIAADAAVQPPLPQLAGITPAEYTVVRFDVDANGVPGNLAFENEREAKPDYNLVMAALQGMKFPATTAGQRLRAMIDIGIICPPQKR